jgi:plasmid stability protein
MPDLLIRNVPPELHARLKAAAAAHRRSLTQEAIQIIESNLSPVSPPSRPAPLEESPRYIDQCQKNRSQPGWAKNSLRILHPVEGPAIPESDWNMLNDDLDPLK